MDSGSLCNVEFFCLLVIIITLHFQRVGKTTIGTICAEIIVRLSLTMGSSKCCKKWLDI